MVRGHDQRSGWYTANPKRERADSVLLARPGRIRRCLDNDQMAIPKDAKNPVLAHHFINYMLDNDHSMKNFSWNGYQAPLARSTPTT